MDKGKQKTSTPSLAMLGSAQRYRVESGTSIRLKECDPDDESIFKGSKKEAKKVLKLLRKHLIKLQELLYAEHKHKILIVLQAMDTAGKDGTIRFVFQGVNPQGVKVSAFKTPTKDELDHDYLWRVHRCVPAKGEIMIFNRSHYEDVLIARVHDLVPKDIWKKRYEHINNFERLLADEGTTILKFFLHIDKHEQKRRLEARLRDPYKRWKFNIDDVAERKFWPEYMKAYQEAIEKTSTSWAPWYIVPANKKWYRNLVVASTLVQALQKLKMSYPQPKETRVKKFQ